MMAYTIDGGFGEHATAYVPLRPKVPEGIDSFDAAPLTCAGVTTYKAVARVRATCPLPIRSRVRHRRAGTPRDPGCGDRRRAGGSGRLIDKKLELARSSLPSHHQRQERRLIEAIQRLGGADQAIALAVSPKAFEQAYSSLRRGGTLVFVALPADNEVKLPISRTCHRTTIAGLGSSHAKDLR